MSFESEIRRDANPTPTRFLLECGAFTPGLGLSFEPYNPFETSYKFLQSGTPKEGDPFDTSFRPTNIPEPIYHPQHQLQDQQHPWVGYHNNDVHLDHEHKNSPGLASPSSTPSPPSSSTLQSPTSPLALHFRKSSVDVHLSYSDHLLSSTHPVEYPAYIDKDDPLLMRSNFAADANVVASASPISLVPADLHRFTPPPSDVNMNNPEHQLFSNDEEELDDLDDCNTIQMQLDHERRYRKRHDSGMELNEVEARELALQQQKTEKIPKAAATASPLSTVKEETTDTAMTEDDEPMQAPMTRSRANSRSSKSVSSKSASKGKTATTTAASANSSKSKSGVTPKATKTVNAGKSSSKASAKASCIKSGTNGGKGSQSKKQPADEESPELKRQRFLERNRLAASKCREKKRLQTLKTIADADVITLRNQELHDQLNDLQEQARSLKTQILCHRDCGCDVIQKFVRSSFDNGMPSSSSSAMMQPHHTHPAFHAAASSSCSSATHAPYHQATLASAAETVDENTEQTGNGAETETETDDNTDDIIDHVTFDQLLEMDDEEDHEFSRTLVWDYFNQAEQSFEDMKDAQDKQDFPTLSRLGHFLKGSSAALGLTKVKASCERLQYHGNRKDATGATSISDDEARKLIDALLKQMREEYDEAKEYLTAFYESQQQ
ncbi:hypothetical protein BGZ73_001338 [Actinomortierella ambigua]|nr:hypothetical protein BGZ73_001338 [Actinomortierella ambigua]